MGSVPDEYEGLIDEVVQCTNELLLFNQMETAAQGGINTVARKVGGALAHWGYEVTELQPNRHHRPREELCKGFRIQRVDVPLGDLLYRLCRPAAGGHGCAVPHDHARGGSRARLLLAIFV